MNAFVKNLREGALLAAVLVTVTWLLKMLADKLNYSLLTKSLNFPAGAGGFSFGGFTVLLIIAVMITLPATKYLLKTLKWE